MSYIFLDGAMTHARRSLADFELCPERVEDGVDYEVKGSRVTVSRKHWDAIMRELRVLRAAAERARNAENPMRFVFQPPKVIESRAQTPWVQTTFCQFAGVGTSND